MEYFKKLDNNLIECSLCEHRCRLSSGQTGICGANSNIEGKMKNLVYGNPIAMAVDPIEKKPIYRFLPGSKAFSIGTYGCNMRCPWCQNSDISQISMAKRTPSEYYSPEKIVELALQYDCKSIAYTYNEPTIFYPYARDIGIISKKNNLKNILVSNGFQTEEVIKDMSSWLDAANIDLKSFNKTIHEKYTKTSLDIILRNLKLIAKSSIHLEITTLIIPDLNDSDKELKQIAEFIFKELGADIPWHVSAFHPSYKMLNKERTSREKVLKAKEIGEKVGLKYVYPGNI